MNYSLNIFVQVEKKKSKKTKTIYLKVEVG